MRMTMKMAMAGAMALLMVLAGGGCEAIQDLTAKMVGAPTNAEVRETTAKLAEAEKAIDELEAQAAAVEREKEKLAASDTKIADRRAVLERMQAELAGKLATSPPEARAILLQSIREVDAQIEGLSNSTAEIARMLADLEEKKVGIEVAAAKARRDLAEHEAVLESVDERTKVAIERATGAVNKVGELAGNFGVPGAGAIASQVSGAVSVGLSAILSGVGGFGLTAYRARKKTRELEEQRDGARRVIANTERFGLKEIATDEATRKAARNALAGDAVALREFALAKAEA